MAKAAVVTQLAGADGDTLSAVCANPRCDEIIQRHTGRGRPRDYHNDECRFATTEAKRRIWARLTHYTEQVAILSERYAAYEKAPTDAEANAASNSTQLTAEQVRIAREAVSKVEGALRFLKKNDEEFAAELVELFEAVAPVVRSHT